MIMMLKNRLAIIFVMMFLILGTVPFALGAAPQKSYNLVSISEFNTVTYDSAHPLSGNKEYVIITNEGKTAVNMKGWKIIDKRKYKYVFPSYILRAKSTVTFFTGKGKNTANKFFGGKTLYILNKKGDIIYLYDAQGKMISYMTGVP
jgi:hypothetical protein